MSQYSKYPNNSGGGGGGSGTVTSVAVSSAISFLSVTGSPITTSGTITLSIVDQAANLVFASPDGVVGSPTFRSLVVNDLPLIPLDSKVSGVLPIANGGTNSSAALNNNRLIISSSNAIVETAAITANMALVSNASGIPIASATTNTEIGFVSGVTSSIQTQLNSKQASLGYTPVNKAGDTMLGDLSFNNAQKATNLVDPSAAQDAATKNYVDTMFAGQVFGNLDGGAPNSIYGGLTSINGGTP